MIELGPDDVLPILRARVGDVPKQMLVVGDPERARHVASLLGDSREIARNREYGMYAGTFAGTTIGVTSHGVGSAGAAICFEELCRAGVRRLIRAGTSGGMQPHIVDGDVVIARAAVRDDGVTARVVPTGFPAVASPDVVMALRAAATEHGPVAEGVVLTSDLFYPHDVLGSDLQRWQEAGVVAVEMECAPLFVIASLYGAQAGAILAVDGNPLAKQDESMAGYDPDRAIVTQAIDKMLTIALHALTAMPA